MAEFGLTLGAEDCSIAVKQGIKAVFLRSPVGSEWSDSFHQIFRAYAGSIPFISLVCCSSLANWNRWNGPKTGRRTKRG